MARKKRTAKTSKAKTGPKVDPDLGRVTNYLRAGEIPQYEGEPEKWRDLKDFMRRESSGAIRATDRMLIEMAYRRLLYQFEEDPESFSLNELLKKKKKKS